MQFVKIQELELETLVVWPWATSFINLILNVFIYKMGLTVSIKGYNDNEMS